MIGHTDLRQIGGDNPPARLEAPPITRRTRKPVRLIGNPHWTDRAIAAVVEIYRSDKMNADAGEIEAR